MDTVAILAVVLVIGALIVKFSRRGQAERIGERLVFRYSLFVRYLGPIVLVGSAGLAVIAYRRDQINSLSDYLGMIAWFFFVIVSAVYFARAQVVLAGDRITKFSLVGSTSISYDDVKEITIYHSTGNPMAAMTRVRGDGTIRYDAMFSGYNELLEETIHRCKNATVVEKAK